MKKLFAGILLLTGLLLINTKIYAGPLPYITYEKNIPVVSDKGKEGKKDKKNKKDKEKMGKASRKESLDGKSSRIKAKDGKARRG
ncbi:MAG: hypothetical protein MRK02_12735 [Candidatus Scalindua sp.]|nr:hypothetical protein [Candidatus Scalindua sp.]